MVGAWTKTADSLLPSKHRGWCMNFSYRARQSNINKI